jgi:NAD(P)H-quinone oxidoreductase subunit 2
VKEPQEMSDVVKNYPAITWNLPGMRPLQVGLVLSLIATSLAGILSNPLFTLANDSVTHSAILQSAINATPANTKALTGFIKPVLSNPVPAVKPSADL